MTQPLIRILQIEDFELSLKIITTLREDAVLDDLSDVSSGSPSVNEALIWNGTQWVPSPVGGAGTGGAAILQNPSLAFAPGHLVTYDNIPGGSPPGGSPAGFYNINTIYLANQNQFVVTGETATNFGSPRYSGSPQVIIAGSPANQTSLEIRANTPGLMLYDNDAAGNEKSWRFVVDEGDFIGEMRSDSGKLQNRWLELTRTGVRVDDLYLYVGQQERAIHAIRGAAVELYHNNINVAETTTAVGGGLRVNNLATGAGFERVLTTSDLGTVINVGAGDGLELVGSPLVIQVDATVVRFAGSPIITGSPSRGDILYDDGSGKFVRLPIGTTGQVLTAGSPTLSWKNPTATGGGSPADQLHVVGGDGITATYGSPDVTIAVDATVLRTTSALNDLGDVLAGSPTVGAILYNDGTNWLKLSRGTSGQFLRMGSPLLPSWQTFSVVSGSPVDPANIVGGDGITVTTGSPEYLIAVDGTVLRTTSSLNDLGDVVAGSPTIGAILYNDGTNWLKLPRGLAGQVLTMGSPLLPSWKSGAGGGSGGSPVQNIRGGDGIDVTFGSPVLTIAVDETVARMTPYGSPHTGSPVPNVGYFVLRGDPNDSTAPALHIKSDTGTDTRAIYIEEAGGSNPGQFGGFYIDADFSPTAGSNQIIFGWDKPSAEANALIFEEDGGLSIDNGSITYDGATIVDMPSINTLTIGNGTTSGAITLSTTSLVSEDTTWGIYETSSSFGFSWFYDGASTNELRLRRHENDATGVNVLIFQRATSDLEIAATTSITGSPVGPLFNVGGSPALIQSVASTAGGLFVRNLSTGTGLERVLTTSDLSGSPADQLNVVGGDGITATYGSPDVTISVDGTVIRTTSSINALADVNTAGALENQVLTYSGSPLAWRAVTGGGGGGGGDSVFAGDGINVVAGSPLTNKTISVDSSVVRFGSPQGGSPLIGTILYSDASGRFLRLPRGTAGQVLTMGSPLLPSWKNITGGSPLQFFASDGLEFGTGSPKGLQVDSTVARQANNETITGNWTFQGGSPIESQYGTGAKIYDGTGVARPVGYNVAPIYEINASDTFDLQHNGFVYHKFGSPDLPVTFTCSESGSPTTLPQGASWVVHNDSLSDITITAGAGVTVNFLASGGAPVAGDVTVQAGGIVTVYKYTDTEYWVWGDSTALSLGIGDLSDVTVGSPTIGAILYNDGTTWLKLSRGTNGQVLQLGSPLLPSWKTLSSADITGSPVNPTNVVGGDGITVVTGSPEVTVSVDATVLRTTSALNDLGDVNAGSPTIGAVLYNDGTNWLKLPRGTSGQFLRMGSPLLPTWQTFIGSPTDQLHVVGGDGITATYGSPEVTIAVDGTVLRTTSSIGSLGDVDLAGLVQGQVLQYEGSPLGWIPQFVSGGSGSGDSVFAGDGITITAGSPLTNKTISVNETVARLGSPQIGSPTRGTIWYDVGDGRLTRLLPGTAGQVLYMGSPLLPSWQTLSSTDITGSPVAPTNVVGGDGITVVTGSPEVTVSVDATVLRTTSNLDDLANVIGSPTVIGDILYFDGTNWNTLARGTAGQVLEMGSPLLPSWTGDLSLNSLTLTTPLDETDGGTGTDSYTQGDILYASAANTLAKLPIGSAGTFLRSDASIVGWSGVSFANSAARGDIIYASGTNNYDNLSIGSPAIPGRVLSISATGIPEWKTVVFGSPADQANIVGGDGITVTTGSPEYTIAVDGTVFRTTNVLNDIADVNAGSPTIGAILYNDGTNWLKLPRGTNGQVLTMGSPLLPSWKFDAFGGSPIDNQFADMKEPTGFVNRTDSSISLDDSTRTFSIQLLGSPTNYEYYIKGVKFTETGTKNIVIPNTSGTHYIYFDTTQTLQSTTTFFEGILTENAYVAAVYWNAAIGSPIGSGNSIYVADERHGITMDGITHVHFHSVLGTQFISGLGLNGTWNPDSGTPTDADVQVDVASGTIRDEDLRHDIVDTGNAVNVYDLEQDITPIAQIPILYRAGTGSPLSGGIWHKKPADNFPLIYSDGVTFTGGSSLPAYNEFTGSVWQLTEVANNRFFLVHILATNDINHPIVGIQGITEYANKPQGKEAAGAELGQLSGLPFEEFTPLATLIFEAKTGYTNTPKARGRTTEDANNYVDWRKVDTFTSTTGLFQNLWSEFVADTGSAIASAPNDTFTFTGGTGISTSIAGDTLTITATGSPLTTTNIVGGDGITVVTGSPQYTVAVDNTVLRTTSSLNDLGDVVAGSPTVGAVLYNDGTNWLKLPRGTNSQVLTMGSPLLPVWRDPAAASGSGDSVFAGDGISIVAGSPLTNKTISVDGTVLRTTSNLDDLANVIGSPTVIGDVLYFDGTNWNTLARGTAGQFLRMGSPLLPTWQTYIGSPTDQIHVVGGDGITVTTGSPEVTVAVDATVARLTGSPPTGSPSQIFQNPNTFLNNVTFEINPTTVDGTGVKRPVGLGVFPPYEIDVSATLDTAHAGMVWHVDAGSPAVTFTAPNDSTIEIGSMWQVQNDDVENVTIAQGSPSVTILRLGAGGAPVAGNVLVQQGGIVTIYKYTDTEYWVYGDSEAIGFGSPVPYALGDLTDVTYGSPTLALGDTLYYNGTAWVNLPRGTAGQVLTMGSPLLPSWQSIVGGSPVDSANIVGGDGITVTTGSPEYTIAVDGTVFRTTNVLNDISDVNAGSPTVGAILYNDGTNWIKLARGTNNQVLQLGSPLLPSWKTLSVADLSGSPVVATNVVGGDGITVTTGSPEVTVAVDSTVLRTTSNLDDLANVVGSPNTSGDVLYFDGTNWNNLGIGTVGQTLTVGSPITVPSWVDPVGINGTGTLSRTVGATWANPGSTVTVPVDDVFVHIPTNGKILSITILGESVSGTCKVDVYKDVLGNYPPTSADSIAGSPLPGITAGRTYTDNTLTGWTKNLTEGDVLAFHLQETSSFEQIYVQLEIQQQAIIFGSPLPPTSFTAGDGIVSPGIGSPAAVAVDNTVARLDQTNAGALRLNGSPATIYVERSTLRATLAGSPSVRTAIANWPLATFRSVDTTVQGVAGTNYHTAKLVALHDGSAADYTEYASLTLPSFFGSPNLGSPNKSGAVATYDFDINGGNLSLYATPRVTGTITFTINSTATTV